MYKINPNYLLYTEGEKKIVEAEENQMYCKEIGEIELSSGKIVACDPFMDLEETPFTKQVLPGKYPILLNIIRYKVNDDERVAYAMVKLSEKQVVKWEMALTEEQNPKELENDEFFGYGVDTGTGCFLDNDSLINLLAYEKEKQKNDPDFYLYLDYEDKFDETYEATRSWLVTTPTEKTTIAMFSTGWGDGYYPSFWGLDEDGEAVCLVTDFLILE